MRVAFVGKGGSGKTTLSALFARHLARSGAPVLAVDGDINQHLAVALGLGWGMVPEAQADPLLRSGRLVALAPDRPVDVPLYWQQWKLDSPALAAVADVVTAAASEALR